MKPDVTAITNANAGGLLEAGLAAIRSGDLVVDLGNVSTVDSAAVALLLAWQRAASQLGKRLSFVGLPAGVTSLAELYDVDRLLQLDGASG